MSIVIDLGEPGRGDRTVCTIGGGQGEGYISYYPEPDGLGELIHADRRIALQDALLQLMARPEGFEGWTLRLAQDGTARVARFPFAGRTLVYRLTDSMHLRPDGLCKVLEMPD